jgi:hypothetical protein
MLTTLANVFGVVLLLVGILGFIPGITTSDQMLLGIFHVNALHNIVHLVSGAAGLWAAKSGMKSAKMYFQVFGVIYALVAVLGFVYGDEAILGLVTNNTADTWLHVVIAVVSLYLGFGKKEDMATPAMPA